MFFFQNKIDESKSRLLFLENYVEKFHEYFCFFHWNPYLKTDGVNLLILFFINDFHKKYLEVSTWSFNLIFPAVMYVRIALGKTQNAANQKPWYLHCKIGLDIQNYDASFGSVVIKTLYLYLEDKWPLPIFNYAYE